MLVPRQWTRLAGTVFGFLLVIAILNHLHYLRTPAQLWRPWTAGETNRTDTEQKQHDGEISQQNEEAPEPATDSHGSTKEPPSTANIFVVEGTRTPETATALTSTSPPHLDNAQLEPTDALFRKTIVMGKLLSEDTSWVSDHVSSWNNSIYVVDLPPNCNNTSPTGLRTKINKAKEATPYLTYIVEHYDDFPDVAAFMHAHRSGWPQAWHNEFEGYDAVSMLHGLRLDTVLARGYVNLRCNSNPGCPAEVDLNRSPFDETRTTEIAYPYVYGQFFNMTPDEVRKQVPVIASPCCAQFAVSKKQVWQRPKAEYQRFLSLIEQSEYDDETLGTVMEYMWHILFGREAVFCEDVMQCYNAVYGKYAGGWS